METVEDEAIWEDGPAVATEEVLGVRKHTQPMPNLRLTRVPGPTLLQAVAITQP